MKYNVYYEYQIHPNFETLESIIKMILNDTRCIENSLKKLRIISS